MLAALAVLAGYLILASPGWSIGGGIWRGGAWVVGWSVAGKLLGLGHARLRARRLRAAYGREYGIASLAASPREVGVTGFSGDVPRGWRKAR